MNLNPYVTQGTRTIVEKGTFQDFPDDIGEICKIIQHLLIHPGTIDLHNLHFPENRIKDRRIKTIKECISRIAEIKYLPLIEYRDPQDRIVNICRHFSMFLCSILREKGIPARCRCGFATYFVNGWFEDHWICEYWHSKENRWIMVDSQIDEIQSVAYHIDTKNITTLDLPGEAFFPAGVLWKLYRQGFISGNLCGFSLEEGEKGPWYIRGNMLRDFFALNKVEYTYQETSPLMDRNYEPNEDDLVLLDQIADLTTKADISFTEISKFCKQNTNLTPVI